MRLFSGAFTILPLWPLRIGPEYDSYLLVSTFQDDGHLMDRMVYSKNESLSGVANAASRILT